MNVRSIPEHPLCAPALRMVVARSMTRDAKYSHAGTAFAAWIANRWSPSGAARLSPPHMMFRKDRKSGAPSVTIRNFLRYDPRLSETFSLQLEFLRNLSFLFTRPELRSFRPNTQTSLQLHSVNPQFLREGIAYRGTWSVTSAPFFIALNTPVGKSIGDSQRADRHGLDPRSGPGNVGLDIRHHPSSSGPRLIAGHHHARSAAGKGRRSDLDSGPIPRDLTGPFQSILQFFHGLLGWTTLRHHSFVSGAAPATTQSSTSFFLSSFPSRDWRLTLTLPTEPKSAFHLNLLPTYGFFRVERCAASFHREFLAVSGAAQIRLAIPSRTEFRQGEIAGSFLTIPVSMIHARADGAELNAMPEGAQPPLVAPIRLEFREGETARSFHSTPASMMYARAENQGVKAIENLLNEVKKSIKEIRVPVPAAAPPREVDVRQLTRQVYDQFERELRIEKERRGR